MLNSSQRNRIVSSYAHTLADIIGNKSDDASCISLLKKIVNDIDMSKFCIKPTMFRKYKSTMSAIRVTIDEKDDIQKFLLMLLSRRYGHLLPDILDVAESKLLKEKKKKINVFSNAKLSDSTTKEINSMIRSQIGDAEIVHCIDKTMKKGDIKFIANGNVCTISIDNILKKILNVGSISF